MDENIPGELPDERAGLHQPADDAYRSVARMAAAVFDAPIVTVAIAGGTRVWFPPGEAQVPAPDAVLSTTAFAVTDPLADDRIRDHPWVQGPEGIRFFATAPIMAADGRVVGALQVMNRKRRRRVTTTQLLLLGNLADIIGQLLNLRSGAVNALRAEKAGHAAEIARRDLLSQQASQMKDAVDAIRDDQRPEWCQLGGERACDQTAELKVADSWGDSAWGCWKHAEEALIQVPSVFLASAGGPGLNSFRRRALRPQ